MLIFLLSFIPPVGFAYKIINNRNKKQEATFLKLQEETLKAKQIEEVRLKVLMYKDMEITKLKEIIAYKQGEIDNFLKEHKTARKYF